MSSIQTATNDYDIARCNVLGDYTWHMGHIMVSWQPSLTSNTLKAEGLLAMTHYYSKLMWLYRPQHCCSTSFVMCAFFTPTNQCCFLQLCGPLAALSTVLIRTAIFDLKCTQHWAGKGTYQLTLRHTTVTDWTKSCISSLMLHNSN